MKKLLGLVLGLSVSFASAATKEAKNIQSEMAKYLQDII